MHETDTKINLWIAQSDVSCGVDPTILGAVERQGVSLNRYATRVVHTPGLNLFC